VGRSYFKSRRFTSPVHCAVIHQSCAFRRQPIFYDLHPDELDHASPSPAAPTASLPASPEAIEKGQSTTLTWETMNATEASTEAIGVTAETFGASAFRPDRL
jgi:hypothetical protein